MSLSNPNRFLSGVVDRTSVRLKPNNVDVAILPGPKGLKGDPGQGAIQGYDSYVLTTQQIADKKVVLSATPQNTNSVSLEVVGAPTQRNSVDYICVGNEVRWASLALELVLEAGDTVIVKYTIA